MILAGNVCCRWSIMLIEVLHGAAIKKTYLFNFSNEVILTESVFCRWPIMLIEVLYYVMNKKNKIAIIKSIYWFCTKKWVDNLIVGSVSIKSTDVFLFQSFDSLRTCEEHLSYIASFTGIVIRLIPICQNYKVEYIFPPIMRWWRYFYLNNSFNSRQKISNLLFF